MLLVQACAGDVGGAANGGSGGAKTNGSGGSSSGSGGKSGGSGGGTGSGNATGSGGASSGSGGSGTSTGGTSAIQPPSPGLGVFDASLCGGGAVTVGSTPIRRLSRVEYNNMVRDLGLGDTKPADQFVAEQKIYGNFNTNSYATISGTLINQQYLEAAETLASNAVANSLSSLVTCTTKDAACATQFITAFAGIAFRGQLDADTSSALLALYTKVSQQFDFPTGIQAVIEAVLTSPRFLFVMEFGQPGSSGTAAAVPLTPMELATRLALYLWRSLPDQTLTTAATSGHLVTAADITTQATRMLADPKAVDALQDFANQWLDIENMDAVTKDTTFVDWSATLAQEMHLETLTTFSSTVLATTKNGLDDLLTSSSSYVNADLKTFYNNPGSYTQTTATGPGVASDYKLTTVGGSAAPRSGILTHGSVLARHAHTTLPSPTLRGRMIRQQILCEQIPEPPASIGGVPIPPPPSGLASGQTTRASYMMHVATNSACSSCHQYMDWLGFGFDDYDATGTYISTENGSPVDSSGQFLQMNATDISGTFTGTSDMVQQLTASPQVGECYTLEQIRYAFGRVESDADACSAQQILQAFTSNNLTLQQLLVAVVTSDSFMYRTPVNAGEACQ